MTTPRVRVRGLKPTPNMPAQAEQDFAASVEVLSALILSESKRLSAIAAERPVNLLESRLIWNLAGAAKALGSGSLWGARAIRAKTATEKPPR